GGGVSGGPGGGGWPGPARPRGGGAGAERATPLSRLPLLTEPERQAVARWNDTRADYPQEHLLHRLVEGQARRSPDAAAVCFGGRALGYRQLDPPAPPPASPPAPLGGGPGVRGG